MLLIVIHHFSVHGPWPSGGGILGSDLILLVFQIGGQLSVALFVMVTGYFCIKSPFRLKTLIRVVFETFFYSILILLTIIVFDPSAIDGGKMVVQSLLPTLSGNYWFVSSYVGMIALSPFLNKLVQALGQSGTKKLILVTLTLLSAIPTITHTGFVYNNLSWFCTLYLLSGYIRLWGNRWSRAKTMAWVCVPYLIILLSSVLILFIFHVRKEPLATTNSIFIVILAVGLFKWFESLQIGFIKFINTVAYASFAVYLIHDNPLVRDILWPTFAYAYELPPIQFAGIGVASALTIYCICSSFDLFRQKAIEAPFMKAVYGSKLGTIFNRYDEWINAINYSDGTN